MTWEWDTAGRLANVATWSSERPDTWEWTPVRRWRAGRFGFRPAVMPLPIGMEPVSPEEMDAAAAVVERAAQRAPWPLKLAIGPRLPIDAQEGANYACGAWIPAPACTVMLALTGRERPLPLVAWHEVHHAVHHLMPPEDRAAVRLHGNRVRTVLQGTQEDSAWWQSLAAGGEAEAESFARFRFGLRPWPGGVEPDEDACRAWMRLVP